MIQSFHTPAKQRTNAAFTLVELLIVIAIISILMTAGVIGLNGLSGGKGVSSAVATSEAMFDEARAIAVGNRTRVRVLVAKELTKNPDENLRRVVVVSEKIDPVTGAPVPDSWDLTGRGLLLPEKVYFSQTFSMKDHEAKAAFGSSAEDTMTLDATHKIYQGNYYFYEFNAEGICASPGASFVVGAGIRPKLIDPPKVTGSALRDFGGIVVWRNGSTSVFRSPSQISTEISSLQPGNPF